MNSMSRQEQPPKFACSFKVRDRSTGLFLNDGIGSPRWSKKGKTWSTIGHPRSAFHFALESWVVKTVPANWEIIVFMAVGHINCDFVINQKKLDEKQIVKIACSESKMNDD